MSNPAVSGILSALQLTANLQANYAKANAELARIAAVLVTEGRSELNDREQEDFVRFLTDLDDAARQRVESALEE